MSASIFDIDHSKITFSAAKTGSAGNGQTYEFHETQYNHSANVRFSTPVVKFELVDNKKGKPALVVNCDEEKFFNAMDTTLKAIKEKCLLARNAKSHAPPSGVYESATGRKSAYFQIFLDGKFGSTPCEIPCVDEKGQIVRSRNGVPQFRKIDIKALSGKLCEGIIEFKLGRCIMPNTKILSHKFQACKVICLKFADRPINAEANQYLEAMTTEGTLDLRDMHNQLVSQSTPALDEESKEVEMPLMSELESMNLANDVASGVLFANSDVDVDVLTPPQSSPVPQQQQQQSFQPRPVFTVAESSYH